MKDRCPFRTVILEINRSKGKIHTKGQIHYIGSLGKYLVLRKKQDMFRHLLALGIWHLKLTSKI